MIDTEIIGYCAAVLTTLAFLPQTLKTIRTRQTEGLSLVMYSLFTAGVLMWLIYALKISSMPMIIANIITLALSVIILYFIVIAAPSRSLTPAEIALIPQSFAAQIDTARIRLIGRAHNPFAIGRILCRGHDLYWKDYPEDFTKLSLKMQAVLMHELCHVWQYETKRLTAARYLTSPSAWTYGYTFDDTKSFDDYPCERQADLLQDWYAMNKGAAPARCAVKSRPPTLAQINAAVPFVFDAESEETSGAIELARI